MPDQDITQLLLRTKDGDREALNALVRAVYSQLHRMAHLHMLGQPPDHTLSTTDLVHNAYERLVDQTRVAFEDRNHFFSAAALAMKHILIDYARKKKTLKRGGDKVRVSLDDNVASDQRLEELLALDEALTRLAALNERLSKVVELRYFGGLTEEEIGAILGINERTVRRDWNKARGWLKQEMESDS